MNSTGINSMKIMNNVGVFNDDVDMNSIFSEYYHDEKQFL